ncbi:MAG: YqiA/YcfP family alpha/beta fold hydrolase, partial [Gemmatimonadota bacterium]|nr:YqiA/YcfP family alpha/beta fold hydrolase [Gemmatimonadota bacterium]
MALVILCGAVAVAAARPLPAQEKPTLQPEDYGRWENLGGAALSPDGAWIAYGVTRVNEESELRIRELEDDSTRVVPWGADPVFSPDSRWLAWSVEPSEEERERLEAEEEPVRNDAAILDLDGGGTREYGGVRSVAFDATGRYAALQGYPPEEPEGRGADLRIVDLETGTLTTFGNVAERAWSDSLSLVAMAIATGGDHAGNGLQVYDAASGRIRSLDASTSAYGELAWREGATDLAALRSREPASEEGQAHDVLAWRDLHVGEPEAMVLVSGGGDDPDALEIVRHATPRWSDDGWKIAIGLRPAEPSDDDAGGEDEADEEEADPADETEAGEEDEAEAGEEEEPDLPSLQIWHSADRRIFPQQKAAESFDERRTLLAVWHVDRDRLVVIGTDLEANARLLEGWRQALEDVDEPYGWGDMFGRPYHDVWQIDVETGERSMALERVRYEWPSAGGGYLVSYDGANYASLDLETGERHDLTSDLPTVFADTAYDVPTDVLPPHASPDWLEGDAGVLLYDDHDVWRVALDGSDARRLTDGAAERITHRVAFEEDDGQPGLDPAEPIYLRLHGEWSEKRGFARVLPDGEVERFVYDDHYVSGLAKADSADVYLYRAMAWDDPPDYFVGPDLAEAERVTDINPFIDEYAWSRSELIDYTSETGRDLQAVLYYPAGYDGGEPVPTIVYTYEIRSPSIHVFDTPSERDYYDFTAWTQAGYAVLQPDIVYEAREPGMSALASVRAAVQAAVDLGVADPDAVGLIGHSWGGYQATFLPTRTDIFAASVAGAPLTDFVSFMGQIHWNPGVPELSHWETGQGRMEVPFWEDPEAHRRNSPIHEVHEMETPLLMAHGNEDGVVDWDQATEFYNFARRAGKQMVLLVYEGEDHGFREEANQVDYHRRILEWFGHYLKGEPAPAWITDGVELEDLKDEKRRVATKPESR